MGRGYPDYQRGMVIESARLNIPISIAESPATVPIDISTQSLENVNMNIRAQELHAVKVLAPSAEAVYVGGTVTAFTSEIDLYTAPEDVVVLLYIDGRGRVMHLAGNVYHPSGISYVRCQIYIDDNLMFDDALISLIQGGAGQSYARQHENGDAAGWYHAHAIGPRGGLISHYWDGSKTTRIYFGYKLEIEFTSSVLLRLRNDDTANSMEGSGYVVYGTYP